MADADRCIGCGEIVPEGRMVCPLCLYKAGDSMIETAMKNLKEAKAHIERALAKLVLAEGGRS